MFFGNKTYVMAILNVTPDSFSGDGVLTESGDINKIIFNKLESFVEDGADVIDVGGESTRPRSLYPDSRPISDTDEITRISSAIKIAVDNFEIPVSIDTMKANVANKACELGASIINDVSMLSDPNMAEVAANHGTYMIISHTQTKSQNDVVNSVIFDLNKAIEKAVSHGVNEDKIIIDPGIGFGKNAAESIELIRNISKLKKDLGFPILVGTSRKSFIDSVIQSSIDERIEGTAASVCYAITQGVDIVRVHDVKIMARVCEMTDALVR